MTSCIKSSVLGGIVLFLWGMFSWMVLPWHLSTLNSFNDEGSVSAVIVANAPQSGIYLSPMHSSKPQVVNTAPAAMLFTAVTLEGSPATMVKSMLIYLLGQIVAAFIVGWMLCKTTGLSYAGRVGFVLAFAAGAALVTHAPYWNWFGFSTGFTLVTTADLLVGWFLAGLVLAKFHNNNKR